MPKRKVSAAGGTGGTGGGAPRGGRAGAGCGFGNLRGARAARVTSRGRIVLRCSLFLQVNADGAAKAEVSAGLGRAGAGRAAGVRSQRRSPCFLSPQPKRRSARLSAVSTAGPGRERAGPRSAGPLAASYLSFCPLSLEARPCQGGREAEKGRGKGRSGNGCAGRPLG